MTRACSSARFVSIAIVAAVAPIAASCSFDPVHDEEVQNLGPEVPGIPMGQYHRAGQPCTICHGGEGPASTVFSLAGTVFASKDTLAGLDHAEVLFVDANGSIAPRPIFTNCVGNFYVTQGEWNPAFPVSVGVQAGTLPTLQMPGQISRAGSCATCHYDPIGFSAAGHVYVDVSVNPNEERKCIDRGVAPEAPEAPGDGGLW
jgi:hypothetical protein